MESYIRERGIQEEIRKQELKDGFRKMLEQYAEGAVSDADLDAIMAFASARLQGGDERGTARQPEAPAQNRVPEIKVETGKWKQELVSAWQAWFNAEGGRHRGDVKQLEAFLKRQLPPDMTISVESDSGDNVGIVTIRDRQEGTLIYGLPLHHDYQEMAPYFEPDRDAKIFERVKGFDDPAVLDAQHNLVKRGKVRI